MEKALDFQPLKLCCVKLGRTSSQNFSRAAEKWEFRRGHVQVFVTSKYQWRRSQVKSGG